jgi:hypothetical protein
MDITEKRKQIREGLARYFYFSKGTPRCTTDQSLKVADSVLRFLHSEGCVLKVDKELPDGLYLPGDFRHPNWLTTPEVKAIMDLAVEPLIEEE